MIMLKPLSPEMKRNFTRRVAQLARDMQRSCHECESLGELCQEHAYELHDVKTIAHLKAAETKYTAESV